MFKKGLWVIIISCLLIYNYGNKPLPAGAASVNEDYVFLVFISELKESDLGGSFLPNIKKARSSGISYSYLANNNSTPEENLLTILGKKNNQLLLPEVLNKNGVKCLLVDGTETMPKQLLEQNNISVIANHSDQQAMDKFINEFNKEPHQFVAIYLDDTSKPAEGHTARFNQWSSADNQLGRLINFLINSDKLNQSTVIIAGGGNQAPLILYGDKLSIQGSYKYCNQLDIAPTICELYGFNPPNNLGGHILYECLQPKSDSSTIKYLQAKINDLQEECLLNAQKSKQLKKEQQRIDMQIADIEKERNNIQRIISNKDDDIKVLVIQLKLLKFFGAIIILLMLIGYFVEYKILRKKFLMFP